MRSCEDQLRRDAPHDETDGEIENAAAAIEAQAKLIAAEVESQQGPPGLADKEITALTAYLQRLGTDIRWKKVAPQAPLAAAAPAPAAAPLPAVDPAAVSEK